MSDLPRTVIVCYRPKPGQADALLDLARSHVPRLRALGLVTDQAPFIMRAADASIVEVFSWASSAAIEQAHTHPEVQAIWQRFDELCTFEAVGRLPEAATLFSEFEAL